MLILVLLILIVNVLVPRNEGKVVLVIDSMIIISCFTIAAVLAQRPPSYNEIGLNDNSPTLPLVAGLVLLVSSLFLAKKCFYPKGR